jgi:hypothetical protein
VDYLSNSLLEIKNRVPLKETYVNIQRLLLKKMTKPTNFSAIFEDDKGESSEKLENLLSICLDIVFKSSKLVLKGQEPLNQNIMEFLESAQKVMLSQVSRHQK